MNVSPLQEKLFSNSIFQALRNSYLPLYENLFLSVGNQNRTILLLPSNEGLSKIAIPQSLVETHILLPAPLSNHYINLLGHGITIQGGLVKGILGFDHQFEREILLEEYVCDGESKFKVVMIDSPIPDDWMQDRQDEFPLPSPTSPPSSITGGTSQKIYTPYSADTTSTINVAALEIGNIVESWKSRWPQFAEVLDTNLQLLERSLLLVPGYEQSVASKYSDVVKTVILPSLYQASESSATQSRIDKPREQTLDTKPSLNQLQPHSDNQQLILNILERFLYFYFQSQLWTFIVNSNQSQDTIIEFVLDSILKQGVTELGDGTIGLPVNDKTEKERIFEIDSKERSRNVAENKHIPELISRHAMSQSSRLASLNKWLSQRKVFRASEMLGRLTEKGGCVDHLKSMGVSLLPHEKILSIDHAVTSASRCALRYFSQTTNSDFWRHSAQFPAESLFNPTSICLTMSLCLSDVEHFTAHLQFTRMVLSSTDSASQDKKRAVETFDVCLQTISQQVAECD